jgi:hypothetical protein
MSHRSAQRDLARAERTLERIGVLLRHDARLPSFTGAVVGGPFRGSWWAHPRTHEIYDLLQRFHRRSGALAVKLVDGKLTYVHPRLWSSLLGVARSAASWRRGLSPDARSVLAAVRRRGALRSDELEAMPPRRRTAAIGELEERLLVHSASVHTETGAHRKRLQTWGRWCAEAGVSVAPLPAAAARAELEAAVTRLAAGTGLRPRLAWERAAAR